MTDLQALLARLEAATGPDRELDGELAKFIGDLPADAYWSTKDVYGEPSYGWVSGGCGGYKFHDPEYYTASIDSAIALVERVLPETGWGVSHSRRTGTCAAILYVGEKIVVEAPTPALAILIALVRAKIAEAAHD